MSEEKASPRAVLALCLLLCVGAFVLGLWLEDSDSWVPSILGGVLCTLAGVLAWSFVVEYLDETRPTATARWRRRLRARGGVLALGSFLLLILLGGGALVLWLALSSPEDGAALSSDSWLLLALAMVGFGFGLHVLRHLRRSLLGRPSMFDGPPA